MPAPPAPGWALLYDGRCGLCSDFATAVRRVDRAGLIDMHPFESVEGRARTRGWSATRINASFHLVSPAGELTSGGDAVPVLAGLLFPATRAIARTPPARAAAKLLYELAASHARAGACPAPAESPR